MRKKTPGKIFVVSAPSGCGKTTLCNRLLDDDHRLVNSISITTRPPRPGEKDGADYHFVSRSKFESIIKKNGFLEYEENFGHFYGTPRKFVENALKKGAPVLLSIDVKGAMKIKRAFPKESVLIFIIPPSVEELKKRLRHRKSDSKEVIARRLSLAKKELSYKNKYDYRIVNDKLHDAYAKLKSIVVSEMGV